MTENANWILGQDIKAMKKARLRISQAGFLK
jgi:hypothetical protein